MGFNGQELVPESVSTCTDTATVALGTRRMVNGVDYVYCYNAGTTSAPAGCWAHVISNGSGFSVDFAGTTKVGIPFGVVRNTTVSAAEYFWLAQRGMVPLRGGTSDNTAVPGLMVFPLASGLFEGMSGVTEIYYNSMVPVKAIRVMVSLETEASDLTGWGYVSF